MTSAPIEELRVPYDPSQAERKARRWRRLLRGQIFTLVLTCAILTALYFWRGDDVGASTAIVYGVIIGLSLAWLLVYLLLYLRAKRWAASVGTGTAVCIDRGGVEVAGARVPWPEVAAIAAVKGRPGRGPRLQVTRTDGKSYSVPFDHIDVRAATLDLTARAYSAGRHGVDLEVLET